MLRLTNLKMPYILYGQTEHMYDAGLYNYAHLGLFFVFNVSLRILSRAEYRRSDSISWFFRPKQYHNPDI